MCLSFVVCIAFAVLTNTVVDAQENLKEGPDAVQLRPQYDGKYVFGGTAYNLYRRYDGYNGFAD